MIALCRADGVRLISDGADGKITVPDIKIPPGIEWGASAPADQSYPNFQIWFRLPDGEQIDTLWQGPYIIGGFTFYIVDAPKKVLQALKNQLGAANVAPLTKALQAKAGLRTWAKAAGFTLIRNTAGRPVGVRSPLVFTGQDSADLDLADGETVDTIPEMRDLEKF